MVHRFEPHFLARHALGPGGDCALVAAIVCASGPLAEGYERDPLGKWAQALNVLEQVNARCMSACTREERERERAVCVLGDPCGRA